MKCCVDAAQIVAIPAMGTAVRGFSSRHRGMTAEEFHQHALVVRVEMLDEDECNPCIRRHVIQKALKSVMSPRPTRRSRRSDAG